MVCYTAAPSQAERLVSFSCILLITSRESRCKNEGFVSHRWTAYLRGLILLLAVGARPIGGHRARLRALEGAPRLLQRRQAP